MPTLSPPPATDHNVALAAALARWRGVVETELKGASFEKKLVTRTPDGIGRQPLYTRADLAGVPHLETLPGEAPFLRGAHAAGHGPAAWLVAQEIAAGTAAEFNRALREDLLAGQNAVAITPDAAARAGLDPKETPTGGGGLALRDVDDFATALKGVDLAAVPVFLDAGTDPLPLATLFLEFARSHGLAWTKLTGGVTADPLGEWAVTGTLPEKLEALYDSLAGWTAWTETYLPALKTIGVNAEIWNGAGGTATQELALALATAADYLRAAGARGVSAAEAAAHMEFRFGTGPQFFDEIAKLRAFRLLWTRVVTAFHGGPAVAAQARVRVRTGRSNETRLDPHVNLLRVTTEALAAVLGGCDALHIAPFDEVTGATTDFSRRIARNVHTLLAEEFNLAATADPAGGSWYVEKLTDEMARKAWALLQDIESRGGMAAALRAGYPQEIVAQAAAEKLDGVAKRRAGLVGTNIYPNLKEPPRPERARGPADPAPEHSTGRLLTFPLRGDWAMRFAAALALAREGATVGQLHRSARTEGGAEEAIAAVRPLRLGAAFEALREAAAAFAARTGARPRVFLARIGPPAQHRARADFSAGFFGTGGFEVLGKENFATAGAAAEAAAASGAPIAVLCSTDETYPELAPAFARAAKTARPDLVVVLAGRPAEAATVAAYEAAGVDEFIHVRANAAELLGRLLARMGGRP